MDKFIGYTLAVAVFSGSYASICIAYPITVSVKAGIDFTVEFLDSFNRTYNATPG